MICPFRKTIGPKEAECLTDCGIYIKDRGCAIKVFATSKTKSKSEVKGK